MIDNIIHAYPDEEFLTADGFDDAIIGVDEESMRIIYSVTGCMKILMERDKMNKEDAWEFFDFNVSGARVGDKTPIWCFDIF